MTTIYDRLVAFADDQQLWEQYRQAIELLDDDESLHRRYELCIYKSCVHMNIVYTSAVQDESVDARIESVFVQDARDVASVLSQLIDATVEEVYAFVDFDGSTA